jgi:hypothetical protein
MPDMKTTLDLPDELMRTVKIRAVQENKKLKDMIAELLRQALAQEPSAPRVVRHRVQFPLIKGTHPAPPGEEMTPDRVAQILLDDEVRWASEA